MQKRGIVVLLAGLLVLAGTGAALAAGSSTASYMPLGPDNGIVHIQSKPGAWYRIYGEQPDNSYKLIRSGQMGTSGSADEAVPRDGPIDGDMQYYVMVNTPDGTEQVGIPDPSGWIWD